MHLVFAASLLVQVALATHAYRHGRVRPWMWIILCFPLVGSLLYAVNYLVPQAVASRRQPRRSESQGHLRRVAPGPFATKGDRPDNAIPAASVAEVEARVQREDCPECTGPLGVDEHRAETLSGRSLRVVVTRCRKCGAMPVRYFEVQADTATG